MRIKSVVLESILFREIQHLFNAYNLRKKYIESNTFWYFFS